MFGIILQQSYDYDLIPAGYYDLIFSQNKGIQSAWHRQKFEFIAKLVPPSGSHLDIGCGPGTFLGNFNTADHAIGVDIAGDQIEYALGKYASKNVSFVHVDGGILPFEDESFDVISMVEVIEHLEWKILDRLMREALRVLKPSGVLVLSTPNYSSPWPLLEWAVNKIAHISYDEQHITKFTPRSLRKYLNTYPVTIVNMGSFLFSGPFFAPIGNGISALITQFESKFKIFKFQFLLYAILRKN